MSCNNAINIDLGPTKINLNIYRGNTWSQTYSVFNDTTPVDLSGSTISIQVKSSADSAEPLLSLSTTDSTITITGDNDNQITLNKLVSIPAGKYVYDMRVSYPSNVVKTYTYGNFSVEQNVTN